jgi:hypothetical protein
VSILFVVLEDSIMAVLWSSAKGIEHWTKADVKVEVVVRATSFVHDVDDDNDDDNEDAEDNSNKNLDRGMRNADTTLVVVVIRASPPTGSNSRSGNSQLDSTHTRRPNKRRDRIMTIIYPLRFFALFSPCTITIC